jgi:hypothetical protein
MLEKLAKFEKLGGILTIIVAGVALYSVSAYQPPAFVQIIGAFIGSIVWLIGVVVLFAEGSIIEERWGKKALKAK